MSVQVMVNGIPGNMGRIVAETCVARGLELVPYSLTGEIIVENESVVAGRTIQLLKPSNREERISEVLAKYPNVICIDYTHPTAVNDNAAFYVKHKIPFVMGTTGGDREALARLVAEANHPSVIAPNMAKQIVARYGKPFTKEFEVERGAGVILLLDTATPNFKSRQYLEHAIRLTAAVGEWLLDREILGRFFIDSEEIALDGGSESRKNLLDALARIPPASLAHAKQSAPWAPAARPMDPVLRIGLYASEEPLVNKHIFTESALSGSS